MFPKRKNSAHDTIWNPTPPKMWTFILSFFTTERLMVPSGKQDTQNSGDAMCSKMNIFWMIKNSVKCLKKSSCQPFLFYLPIHNFSFSVFALLVTFPHTHFFRTIILLLKFSLLRCNNITVSYQIQLLMRVSTELFIIRLPLWEYLTKLSHWVSKFVW